MNRGSSTGAGDVVVFDLDDTLFPEEQFVMSGFRAIDAWLQQNLNLRGFLPVAEQIFHGGERRSVFDCALQQLGVSFDEALIAKLVNIYREHVPQIELFADAQWAIAHARQLARTAIITDGYLVMQQNKVQALRLDGRIDLIVYSDIFGREGWKPSPRPYLEVMTFFGCPGENCIYIGDNPTKDFVTARKLGWKTVRVARKNGIYRDVQTDEEHEANQVISDLWHLEYVFKAHFKNDR
jgi:putative hydrolase of the HAD superfamily